MIIFDRPGFGYSERPRGRLWTANEQAELLHKAIRQIGVERPVVVGHSWGAIVALALAEQHPADIAGLVLLSGYYFWTLRPDVLPVAIGALPIIGDILRYTVSPLFGWLTMPLFKRMLFSPAQVPARFQAEYSPAMALRPSQIRATSVDGALMIPGALSLRGRYKELSLPVVDHGGRRRQGRFQALGRAAPCQHQGQRPADHQGCWAHGSSSRAPASGGSRRGGQCQPHLTAPSRLDARPLMHLLLNPHNSASRLTAGYFRRKHNVPMIPIPEVGEWGVEP